MEIHQLRYFVAVAEVGSFGGAARRCNVAQPSLSQQIKKLETELGHPLFERLGRTIALTEAGDVLLPTARRILADVRDLTGRFDEQVDAGTGRLTVGAIPTIAPYVLPRAVQSFRARRPAARVEIREDFTERLVDAVLRAEIDIALTSTPVEHDALETTVLFEEPLLLAVPESAPVSSAAETCELGERPLIWFDEIHCFGRQVRDFYRSVRVSPDIVCRTSQLQTARTLVALGLGQCLVPRMLAESDRSPGVRYLSIADRSPTREIAVIRHSGRTRSRPAEAFLEGVKSSPNDF